MNKENIDRLLAHLESLPDAQFDWNRWLSLDENECATAACVAGWCCVLNGTYKNKNHVPYFIVAEEWLGLTRGQARLIFFPINLDDIEDWEMGASYNCYRRYYENCGDEEFINKDIEFLLSVVGKENIRRLWHDPKLMAKLIRSYVEKWQKENSLAN